MRDLLLWPGDESGIRGPFAHTGPTARKNWREVWHSRITDLTMIFGERCSWRWLLPLCPRGGSMDPLEPPPHDAHMCASWISFGTAIERSVALILEQPDERNVWVRQLAEHADRPVVD